MVFGLKKKEQSEGGIILFNNVEEAIRAERLLMSAGYEVMLVAPPPALRRGCDLAVEINLVEQTGIERLLAEKKAGYLEIVPVKGRGTLLDVVKVTDFGEAVMVKAGNMKLTFEKETGRIVNVSGGGCPDIPYLHAYLLDKKLAEVRRPKEDGHTLCSLMLDRAFIESLDIWKNNGGRS
ncbi:MAG: DUF3343 domain-containing protein [Syntrophobacterales bacterium]|jgi:hypothetical protein|nr:DUF3343 domain-containing protein [Syntrophobacterales bacterium]